MGWNSTPSEGVTFSGNNVNFPSNYTSEDKVYILTYSDSGVTSNAFSVTVKHVTTSLVISSDTYLLDGTTTSTFTITYGKRWEDGSYSYDGLTLSAYTISTDTQFPYTFTTSGVTSSNQIYQRFSVSPNDVNLTKQMRFKCFDSNGIESEEVLVEQGGADQTILPNFDFLTFKFNWTDDDGHDLDTMTWIDDDHIKIYASNSTTNFYHLNELGVGYSGPGTGITLSANTSMYIQHGGDNTNSGDECVLINFKELCNRDWISSGITKLYAYSFASWFVTKKNGNCTVSMTTYKGDGMKHGTDDNRFIFVPSGNTEMVSSKEFKGNVYAHGHWVNEINSSLEEAQTIQAYSNVFKFEYDIRSKSASVQNLMTTRSGRCVTIDYEYNGKTTYGESVRTLGKIVTLYYKSSPYPQSGGTAVITFNDSKFKIYENGISRTKTYNETTIGYWSTSTGGEDYITDVSYSNSKLTIVVPSNPTNVKRNFAINLIYDVDLSTTKQKFTFSFEFYQEALTQTT